MLLQVCRKQRHEARKPGANIAVHQIERRGEGGVEEVLERHVIGIAGLRQVLPDLVSRAGFQGLEQRGDFLDTGVHVYGRIPMKNTVGGGEVHQI